MAAILTGMFPRSLNLEDPEHTENLRRLHEGFTTTAEILRARGYHTIGLTANPYTAAAFGMAQGFDEYEDPDTLWQAGYAQEVIGSDELVENFLERLDEVPDGERFFGHLVLIDAHEPWRQKLEVDADDGFRVPPRGERDPVDLYDLQLSHVDESVGALLDALEQRGRADDLLVFLNGDHGERLGRHPRRRRGHGRMVYNPTIWVPWVVWHRVLEEDPATRGGTRAGMVQQVDMLPTLLGLLGIDPDAALRGHSELAGTSRASDVLGAGASPPLEQSVVRTRFLRADKAAVVTPQFKLVVNHDHDEELRWRRREHGEGYWYPPPVELYRYRDDRQERHDLHERLPGVVRQLRGLHDDWREAHPPLVPAEEVRVSREELAREVEALRALGYLDR